MLNKESHFVTHMKRRDEGMERPEVLREIQLLREDCLSTMELLLEILGSFCQFYK